MVAGKPKAKALAKAGQRGTTKAVATKGKRPGPKKAVTKKSPSTGKKKGKGKEKGGKRKKRKKKGPRCPIKRRRKALKRKCYSMTDPTALLNSYYTNHGVVELLKFRKFKWKKKKKDT